MSKQTCPLCKKQLVRKSGKYGPFLSCSAWPECKWTKTLADKSVDESTEKNALEGLQNAFSFVRSVGNIKRAFVLLRAISEIVNEPEDSIE